MTDTPKRSSGRPTLGSHPMTATERSAARRARLGGAVQLSPEAMADLDALRLPGEGRPSVIARLAAAARGS